MKKEIIYPGNFDQPCTAEYDILNEQINGINYVNVNIYELDEKKLGGINIDIPEICQNVVNKILNQELSGVRLDFIKFFYIWSNFDQIITSEIRYEVDATSYIQQGGIHTGNNYSMSSKIKSWLISQLGGVMVPEKIKFFSRDVIAGAGSVRITESPLQYIIKQD